MTIGKGRIVLGIVSSDDGLLDMGIATWHRTFLWWKSDSSISRSVKADKTKANLAKKGKTPSTRIPVGLLFVCLFAP